MKVLVIEDSQRLRRALEHGLKRVGYAVDLVADGNAGLNYARGAVYDAIVLDIMLPGMDGLSVLRELRATGNTTHILILSAKDRVEDRIRGLQIGADDYMVKPFSFDELCARLNTLMRRQTGAKNPQLTLGPVTLNTATKEVRRDGQAIDLTPGEFAIMERLIMNRTRVLTKQQLLDAIHASDAHAGLNVIEVMVCNLRRKTGRAGEDSLIKTRRGFGYFVE